MGRVVEAFWFEDVADGCIGVFFEHQCAENGLFDVGVARLYAPGSFYGRFVLRFVGLVAERGHGGGWL